jgi:hypothetical protein
MPHIWFSWIARPSASMSKRNGSGGKSDVTTHKPFHAQFQLLRVSQSVPLPGSSFFQSSIKPAHHAIIRSLAVYYMAYLCPPWLLVDTAPTYRLAYLFIAAYGLLSRLWLSSNPASESKDYLHLGLFATSLETKETLDKGIPSMRYQETNSILYFTFPPNHFYLLLIYLFTVTIKPNTFDFAHQPHPPTPKITHLEDLARCLIPSF